MQAVCFDFDGTLVDSEVFHAQTWLDYLASLGVHIEFDEFMTQFAGVTWNRVAAHFIEETPLSLTVEDMVMVMEQKTTLAFQVKGAIPAKSGVNSLLEGLYGVCPLAIVTGAPRHYVEWMLKEHNWLGYFSVIVCGDDVMNNKPAPDVYQLACQRLGCEPHQALAIEDSLTGMQAALSAGLSTMVVCDHALLWTTQADWRFFSLLHAYDAIELWLQRPCLSNKG